MFVALLLPFGPYDSLTIEGWPVKLERTVARDKALWTPVERELRTQLYRIAHIVPDGPLKKLRQVTIWIHKNDPGTRCMAYHPGAEYLKEHKMNPAMTKGVEIGNCANFVSWTYEQPWMLLHELAHAYHDRFLPEGFENRLVLGGFGKAKAGKAYELVLHWNGKYKDHYALTNQMEYFAESTEAYFGQNDFYPFNNSELKTFDPSTYEVMEKVWGKPQKRLPPVH